MNDSVLVQDLEKSEFSVIINSLKTEISKLEENAKCIMEKTCMIREIREPQPVTNNSEKMNPSMDILSEFSMIIENLRRNNNILNEAKIGLARFIG